jgi:RNA polymerase sigma-70 factor (ECF subfamily)
MVSLDKEEKSRSRQRLMARAQDGDKEAFQILFREIGPLVTGFVRRRVRDQADVEDVCQEALIAVYKSRQTYQSERPFEPWLFAIVRNVTAEHLKRQRQRSGWQEPTENLPEVRVDDDAGVALELEDAFALLSPNQLEALRLTKILGLPIEEAARRAGTTPGSMKVRVHRAFEAIKRSVLR